MKKLFMFLALVAMSFTVNNSFGQSSDPSIKVTKIHGTSVKVTYPTTEIQTKDRYNCSGKKLSDPALTGIKNGTAEVEVLIPDEKAKAEQSSASAKSNSDSSGGNNTGLILGIIALVAIVAIALAGRRYFGGGNANNNQNNDVNLINAVGNNGGYLHVTEANGRNVVLTMNRPSATSVQLRHPQTIPQQP